MANNGSSPALTTDEKALIVKILQAHGVQHASLFGSYAREEAHWATVDQPASDIDLVVKLRPGASLLDLAALGVELEDQLGRRFDLVTAPEQLHPLIRERVGRDQEILL